MSPKLWAIVRREYLERVRTKGFLIATILGPLLMSAFMVVPVYVARQAGAPLDVAVLDRTGTLGPAVEEALRQARLQGKARFVVEQTGNQEALRQAVLSGRLDGYLELPADGVGAESASYFGRNVSNSIDLGAMQRAVSDVFVSERLAAAGLDAVKVKGLTRELRLRTIRLSEKGQREEHGLGLILPIVLLMILYTSILMWGQMTMTGVIEEKGSRVIEVLASGVSPTQLLTGKLLGIGGAGLTQFLVWAVSLLGVSLASGAAGAGAFALPEITPIVLVSFVLFFLLGFTFYAALYSAIGSAVNTVQEAQQLVFPVVLPLVAGLICFPAVLQSPNGGLSLGLSLLPPLTPLIMFLRIVVQTPPLWQIALSIALLVAAIAGVLWLSARIYRIGILMYGKKPTFPELLRWVRHA